MGRLIAIVAAMLMAIGTNAQELEYKYEVGVMAGIGSYMGDGNFALFKNLSPAASAVARYNINPRMALKANIGWSKIKGNLDDRGSYIPERPDMPRTFDNSLVDVGCQFEAGFFGYGMGGGYKGHKRLVPYIQAGLGFTFCNKIVTMNIPIGFGVKYKLMERLNVGLDWTVRFSMSDKLDGVADPTKIDSGFLKNKDTYTWTMLYITYDICPKYRKCNNE